MDKQLVKGVFIGLAVATLVGWLMAKASKPKAIAIPDKDTFTKGDKSKVIENFQVAINNVANQSVFTNTGTCDNVSYMLFGKILENTDGMDSEGNISENTVKNFSTMVQNIKKMNQ